VAQEPEVVERSLLEVSKIETGLSRIRRMTPEMWKLGLTA